jgi:hypothetical protein
MKTLVFKWLAVTACVLGVILGCSSAFDHAADDASMGTGEDAGGGASFAVIDSEFSDAPVSPGGTGGLPDEDEEDVVVIVDDEEVQAEETASFFSAFQIDPEAEDTAGPKFLLSADIDRDGLLDLVSGWNQSQPVQLHLQRRDAADNISFRTITLAGTWPIAVIAGVQVGLINDDEWLDVVVLSKATGAVALCPPEVEGGDPGEISELEGAIFVYFSPGNAAQLTDGDAWIEMELVNPFVADPWIHNQFPGRPDVGFVEAQTQPEWSGFTDLVVANVDGQPGDDIIVALNPGVCKTLGQEPPLNTVDLWTNPGPGLATTSELWGAPPPGSYSRNVPIALLADAPPLKDIAVMDVDSDGDLDVIATYTTSITQNVRWARNPLVPHSAGLPGGYASVITGVTDGWRFFATEWEERPVGQLDTGADMMALGDLDGDGFGDIVVRSTIGQVIQWFRQPNPLTIQPEFPPNDPVPDRFNFPWPVFTLTEFNEQEPEAIAVGELTGDGQLDLVVAAEGAVFWYDGTIGDTVYDPWVSNSIIQDSPPDTTDPAEAAPSPPPVGGAGVGVTRVDRSTHINTLLIVDLDQDGRNDIVGTLDRRSGAGLSDDRLVWYRNIRTEEPEPAE